MKNYKKILLGVGLPVLFLAVSLFSSHKALAYVATSEDQVKNASFSYVDALTVTGNIGGQDITFKADPNPIYMSQIVYKAQGYDCTASISMPADVNKGFSLDDIKNNPGFLTPSTQVAVNIDYNPNQTKCTSTSPDNLSRTIGNTTAGTAFFAKTDSSTFTNILNNQKFTNPQNNTYFLSSESSCVDRVVANGSGLTYFELSGSGVTVDGTSLGIGDIGSCKVLAINFIQPSNAAKAVSLSKQTIAFVDESTSAPGGDSAGGTTTAKDNSCEAQYTGPAHVFNWAFCGILDGMDSMFGTINGQVEGQLNICTGKSSTSGDTCGNNLLTPQVEKSWAVFRDLATALLVIAMLVMVISQAISFGPFDAYTVRKMLPKLAAAAILMQVSWPLFKFFIDLSNDFGRGIQDLMLAPFGWTGQLHFDSLIASAGGFAPSVAVTSLFTTLVVAAVFSGLTIMGVMLLGASAILSVIVGLLVLLLRQMLIILSMILAPIALIAWVLPGTQRYWKLWLDNFTKLLVMFPLIMAMIAAGKIFAKIGVDTGTGFFGIIIVFVGFLAPLWFLPKTFKWGGQIFAAASSGALNATKAGRSSPSKYALAGAKANREQKRQNRAERLGDDKSSGARKRWDTLMAGGYNYTLSRGSKGALSRRFEGTKATGREGAEKALAQAIVGSEYERMTHPDKLAVLETVGNGNIDKTTGIDGSDSTSQKWALDELAKYGDWDKISDLRDRGRIDNRAWEAFVAKNISAIHQKAPHLSPLKPDLGKDVSAEEMINWHGEEADELERQFDGKIRDNKTGELKDIVKDPSDPIQLKALYNHQQGLVDLAQRALSNDQIADRLAPSLRSKLESIRARGNTAPAPVIPRVEIRSGGGRSTPSRILLPTDLGTTEARNSIRETIIGGSPSAPAVTTQLARRIAEAPAGSPDEANFRRIMDELRAQAASSPQAAAAHNQLLDAYNTSLNTITQEAERQAVADGMSAPDVAATTLAATQHGLDKIDRIDAMGAGTPLKKI